MPALKLKDKDGNWIPLPTIKGVDGKSAYEQAVAGGYKGTEAEFQKILATGPWLPVSGGAMTGELDMGYNAISFGNSAIYFPEDEGELVFSDPNLEMRFNSSDGHPNVYLTSRRGGEGVRIMGVLSSDYEYSAANKEYVDSKTLVFSGKTIATTAWVSDSTYSAQGYVYRASVACAGVTASHRPDVAFSAADAVSGNFAPVAESYGGGVYIYCKTKPTDTVTIPSIVCIKGA